uniref:Uncharacterized protein n=1 Tax=Eptatretus burgeri TaxID=7764 RepID=A0A8C4QT15_EPTBU
MSPKKRAHIGRYSNASKKKKACIQEADSSAYDFEEQSLIQEDSTRSLEGLLLEEKRHKLEKRRRSQQIARQTEPQENRMERLQKNKERQRIARQTESQEKRTERLQKNKERQRIARQNETEVQRQQRLKKNRNRRATSRLQTICHEVPESNNGSIEQDRQQHSVQQTRTSERKQNHTQNNSSNKGLHNTAAQPPSPAADCGNDEDEDEGDDEMDGFEILRIKIEDLKSDGPEDEGPEDGMVKTRNIEPGSLVFMGLKEERNAAGVCLLQSFTSSLIKGSEAHEEAR